METILSSKSCFVQSGDCGRGSSSVDNICHSLYSCHNILDSEAENG